MTEMQCSAELLVYLRHITSSVDALCFSRVNCDAVLINSFSSSFILTGEQEGYYFSSSYVAVHK